MYWIAAGLLFVGTVCGTFIRVPFFIGILVVAPMLAAFITFAASASGPGTNAVIAVVILQVGYVAGLVIRAARRHR
jgi:hypothetical protein